MVLLIAAANSTDPYSLNDLPHSTKPLHDGPRCDLGDTRTCQYFYVVADGKTNQAVGMEASFGVFSLVKPGESHPRLPTAVTDCVLLSAGDRYTRLVERAQSGHGQFTVEKALELMSRPVAMKSNLHNVLFEPKSTKLWVANASPDKQPAAEQKYFAFQLSELLKRQPEATSPEIPLAAK